jgi:2-iminobutanoate/2-iminopropanoate deaminase
MAKGKLVFVSGQVPVDPKTGAKLEGDIRRETAQTIENMRAILEAGGASLKDVVKVNVYLRDLADFDAMNEVYKTYFHGDPPARTTIGCQLRVSIEMDCIAVIAE